MVALIKFSCPSCRTKLKIAREKIPAGRAVKCNKCSSRFRLRASAETKAPAPQLPLPSPPVVKSAPKKPASPSKTRTAAVSSPSAETVATKPATQSPAQRTPVQKPSVAPAKAANKAPGETKPVQKSAFVPAKPAEKPPVTSKPFQKPSFAASEPPADEWTPPPPPPPPAKKIQPPPRKAPATSGDSEPLSPLVKWGVAALLGVLLIVGVVYLISAFSGPSVGMITGQVLYDNAPVKSGQVAFMPKSGIPIVCPIKEDGTYEAKGVDYGELIITVVQPNPDYKDQVTLLKEAKGKLAKLPEANQKMNLLPEIYSAATTSPLRFKMEKGKNTHEIRLDKQGK